MQASLPTASELDWGLWEVMLAWRRNWHPGMASTTSLQNIQISASCVQHAAWSV